MTSFIDTHRERHGVEPICTTLQVAPSTYYTARRRQPSRRELEDQWFKAEICRVHQENLGVYGVDKVWHQLGREGILVGRDRVARLMRGLGLRGVVRGRTTRTEVATSLVPAAWARAEALWSERRPTVWGPGASHLVVVAQL